MLDFLLGVLVMWLYGYLSLRKSVEFHSYDLPFLQVYCISTNSLPPLKKKKLKHKTLKSNLCCLNLIFGKSYTFSRLQSQPVRWEGDLLVDMYGAFQLYHLCIQQSISGTRGSKNEAWVICSLKL